jgi:uncharacterized protein (TIGR02145 family)
MLTNLAYGGTEAGTQFTSGAGQSTTGNGAASGTIWDRTNPPASNQKQWVDPTTAAVTQYNGTRCATAYRTTAASINYTECGFLYNWCAALGNSNSACGQTSGDVANAGVGLCPAGWRLPTGGSSGEFQAMYTAIDGTHANLVGASSTWRGVYSGYFYAGLGLRYQSTEGDYWSATASSSIYGYSLGFGTSGVSPANYTYKYGGFAVRCIAQTPAQTGDPIQNITKATCPSTITNVYDTRDSHYYSVQKLADGNCWMLTNLAYGGNTTGVGDKYDPGVQFASGAGQDTEGNGAASSTIWDYTNPPYNNQKQWVNPTTATVTQGSNGTRCATAYRTSAASINYTECGFLYNWCAALGSSSSACAEASSDVDIYDAGVGLCPSGWRLPTRMEYDDMYAAIGGTRADIVGASSTWRGAYSGLFYPSQGLQVQSGQGYYWAATAYSATFGYFFAFSASRVYSSVSTDKYYGYAVRCITA